VPVKSNVGVVSLALEASEGVLRDTLGEAFDNAASNSG
jgi:hypothetical protein